MKAATVPEELCGIMTSDNEKRLREEAKKLLREGGIRDIVLRFEGQPNEQTFSQVMVAFALRKQREQAEEDARVLDARVKQHETVAKSHAQSGSKWGEGIELAKANELSAAAAAIRRNAEKLGRG